ncbi:Transposase IS116/IS110/IS902 family protein [compost metagenome]
MIKTILSHIDFLTEQVELLDQEVALRVSSFHEDIERLDSIPGISTRMAEQILAEIGTDIQNQFSSAAHMCSWAGLVPGHNESAGKRRSSKTKKGNKYWGSGLTEAAHSVKGSKNYLGALYRRTAARKGRKRAGIVVAHAMLRISYYLLTRKHGKDTRETSACWSVKLFMRQVSKLKFQVTASHCNAAKRVPR